MKEENKKEIKKGVLTGAGTVAGAVVGVVVENTINAADAHVKDPEELAEAIVEESDETLDIEPRVEEVENLNAYATVEAPQKSHHQPEKPIRNSAETSTNVSVSAEDTDPIVEAEAVIEEAPEAIVETIAASETEADEDIMIVSVQSEELEAEEEGVSDEVAVISETDVLSDNDAEGPDYADMKDNDLNVGNSSMSVIDMPDYVNDANVDSFTDNV